MWKCELVDTSRKINIEDLGYEREGILDIFKSFAMNTFFCLYMLKVGM